MKYPQAYVFFKPGSAIKLADVESICGSDMDIALFSAGSDIDSALGARVKLARKVAQSLSAEYLRHGPCVVINTAELHSFFALKFSSDIQRTVWMASAQDYSRLRSGLAIFKSYWLLLRGLELSVRNHNRIAQVLGQDCPEFKRDPQLISSLDAYEKSLDATSIMDSMRRRLEMISRFGKHKI